MAVRGNKAMSNGSQAQTHESTGSTPDTTPPSGHGSAGATPKNPNADIEIQPFPDDKKKEGKKP
jgi:hypothetical protein